MMDITEAMDIENSPEIHCSSCKNLLSVSPILMDVEGNNFCGRCITKLDEKRFIRNIHYERLAVQFSFPCKNLSEGCSVKKKFNEIKTHEEKCPYQILKCPVETCAWSGITTELIIHFNLNHEKLRLKNDDEKQLLTTEGCFMLIVNIFYFLIKWIHNETSLNVEVKSLNFIDSSPDIKIVCTMATNSENVKTSHPLTLMTNTIIDLHQFQKIFSIKLVLPQNIITNKLEELNKIKCPNCGFQMAPPILKCPNNHITCLECTRADYDFCGQCLEDELHFVRQHDLELITVSSLYTCKWEGCEKQFSFKQIQIHEQGCSKRTFMCIHCFQCYSFYNEIISHDAMCYSKKNSCPVITGNEITILGTITGMEQYLILAFHEMFWVICKPTEIGTINISVSNFGPVLSLDWYCYEADLQHMQDSDSSFNKTFSIKNKTYNEYTLDVPFNDIAKFGESKCFKITARIILLNICERNKNMKTNFRRFS